MHTSVIAELKKGGGAVKYLKYEINKEVKIKPQKLSYI